MKVINLLCIGLFLALLSSCSKDEPMGYIGRPGFYFNGNEFSYSFAENPWLESDTVKLPILLTGKLEDYPRIVKTEIVKDSTTATEEMFELLDGVIEAGAADGVVPVVLHYVPALDDTAVVLKIQAVANNDFQELDLVYPSCKLSFTAKIMKPFNWDGSLDYAFGTYSTAWWKFIMEKTGRSSLPYWDLFAPSPNPDEEKYNMSYYEMCNIQQMIRVELQHYNDTSTTGPLLHDDGEEAGQQVIMPSPM